MNRLSTLRMLTRYKAWANEITFRTMMALAEEELLRPRATRYGDILHTLNHVYVIDDIFRAHLEGGGHRYTARNTERGDSVAGLWGRTQALDRWYVGYAEQLRETLLDEVVEFEFIGGGSGAMTREAIVLHVVNHGTYHRGFVGDMLYQVPTAFQSNDLTVFLRDRAISEERAQCSATSR
ncbi:DinB family protein [Sphingomonas soli]|uniref:DinB family protein n=1 Tax=Sphingomonas soli TaxID=266127 RepID=UPI000AD8F020|nr:DinB family protein [Sphingomonas soli]